MNNARNPEKATTTGGVNTWSTMPEPTVISRPCSSLTYPCKKDNRYVIDISTIGVIIIDTRNRVAIIPVGLIKEKKAMTYDVRVSTIESGWETVYEGTKEKCMEEYQNQLEVDKEEGTTNFATQVIDGFGNVVIENKGDDYYKR